MLACDRVNAKGKTHHDSELTADLINKAGSKKLSKFTSTANLLC